MLKLIYKLTGTGNLFSTALAQSVDEASNEDAGDENVWDGSVK